MEKPKIWKTTVTLEEFTEAINAAKTYADAKAVLVSQEKKLFSMGNADRDKWRSVWKKRKAALKPS